MVVIPKNISGPSGNATAGSAATPAYTSTNPLEEADRRRPMGEPPLKDAFGRAVKDNIWWREHTTLQFGRNWLEVIAAWFQMQKSSLFSTIDPNHKFLNWTEMPEWRYQTMLAALTGKGPYGHAQQEFNPIDRDPDLGTHQIIRIKDNGADLSQNRTPETPDPATADRDPLPSTPISFSRLDLGMVR